MCDSAGGGAQDSRSYATLDDEPFYTPVYLIHNVPTGEPVVRQEPQPTIVLPVEFERRAKQPASP